MHNYPDSKTRAQRRWMKEHFRAAWPKLTVGVVFSLVSVGLQLLNPWPLKILVDSVFGDVPAPGFLHDLTGTFSLLVIVATAYVALYLVSGLLEIADTYLTTLFTNQLSIALQTAFFYHILNLPESTRRKVDSGDYVYRLNEQADNLPVLIFSTAVSVIASICTILAAIIILAILNWQMAVVGMLVVPLLYISIKYFSGRIESVSDEIAQDTSSIYSQSSESIQNATLIQAFNRQGFQVRKFSDLLQSRAHKSVKLNLLNGKFDYVSNIFTASGVAIVLLLGGYKVFHQELTVGELLIFITYMSYLYDPIENILSSLAQYKVLNAGIKRVRDVLDEPVDLPDSTKGGRFAGKAQGHIVFKDVSFNRGDKTILEHVNFEIQPGQKVAFVGPSGSGKSTILSLLPRFNQISSGFIYLDSQEIKQLNLENLREQFGIVSQEAELLSGSIHENIGFAIPDEKLDLPDIIVAAEAANAYDFIKKLPEGLETTVGEAGSSLSGGQKQRIAIARAFVRNAPILLLDEPTSALDRTSSAKIIAAIRKLMVGKTVLMATHEISLLKAMDEVYIVDHGSVAKVSDPAQLEAYISSLVKDQDQAAQFRFN